MKKRVTAAGCFLAAFVLWTIGVSVVDVQAVGPLGSTVGFAALNKFVHDWIGVHFVLYEITDWLGLVPFAVAAGFGLLGLAQWIKRKRLWEVDFSILMLGCFYAVVIFAYGLFEVCVVNYRPVLIDGTLEASYPSSTTMLASCILPTAMMQARERIRNIRFRRCVNLLLLLFAAFLVIGRVISGVHWISDIIGGMLLSTGLVLLYAAICGIRKRETGSPEQTEHSATV